MSRKIMRSRPFTRYRSGINIIINSFPAIVSAMLSAIAAFSVQAERVPVAVASNFIGPMKKLVLEYQKRSDDTLVVSYGSSGKIYAQILKGAPFEVFLSADQHKPEELEKRQLIKPGSRFTYATGSLVLWSRDEQLLSQHMPLRDTSFTKIALANRRTAPYGKAAWEVIQNLGLAATLEPKLITGENIAQTFMFVNSKNAQAGFIAYSQYLQLADLEKGSAIMISPDLHKPIKQDAVLLNNASDSAGQFFTFLKSPTARAIISQSGYTLAGKSR